MSSATETAGHVMELVDLQIEFTAAEEAMNKAWVIYRNDRSDETALEAYTASLERCEELKTAIYQFKLAGRKA